MKFRHYFGLSVMVLLVMLVIAMVALPKKHKPYGKVIGEQIQRASER